ncbi:hypothetical protein BDW02DRAFT_303080 [Decorospora gaudefroyi]|uniref:Uncharacterized protein n=1 Tax=Decorospora gaudefroyi TaxID=184978 RepID=A0A6A5KKA0_9PLEO|nr:hypothetical protein BDW02DRAFT_303080 [Decorospora gaudefroyi]
MSGAYVLLDNTSILVERSTLQRWFPRLGGTHYPFRDRFEADRLIHPVVNYLDRNIGVPIEPEDVRKALEKTFKVMAPYSRGGRGSDFGSTGERHNAGMTKLLREDIIEENSVRGLHRSRKRFLILCVVAQREESQRLAQALVYFLSEHVWEVAKDEDEAFLGEWCFGLKELQSLVAEPILQHLFHQLTSFGNYGWRRHGYHDHRAEMMRMLMEAQQDPYLRGRAPLAIGGPTGWYPRARSLPLVQRRRSRDMRLALPMLPTSALTSPVMSPGMFPQAGYFGDIEDLQYQQGEMNKKLDNVDEKLDRLLVGAMYE